MDNLSIQGTLAMGQSAMMNGKIGAATSAMNGINQAEKTKLAAQDFEAVFISQMMEHMFSGVKTDGMFGGGNTEEIFRSMMIEEHGKQISAAGGIGIADALQKQLLEMQAQHSAKGQL